MYPVESFLPLLLCNPFLPATSYVLNVRARSRGQPAGKQHVKIFHACLIHACKPRTQRSVYETARKREDWSQERQVLRERQLRISRSSFMHWEATERGFNPFLLVLMGRRVRRGSFYLVGQASNEYRKRRGERKERGKKRRENVSVASMRKINIHRSAGGTRILMTNRIGAEEHAPAISEG